MPVFLNHFKKHTTSVLFSIKLPLPTWFAPSVLTWRGLWVGAAGNRPLEKLCGGQGSSLLRMDGQVWAWKNQCSIVILSRLCLLKKAVSCGYSFANGLKPRLYLVMQMLACKDHFIFNINSVNILNVHHVPCWPENGFGWGVVRGWRGSQKWMSQGHRFQ